MSAGNQREGSDSDRAGASRAPRLEGRVGVCHIASGDLWAGAEIQIAGLLKHLPRQGAFRLSLILLNEGRLAEEARRSGVEVKVISESTHSFLRIIHEARNFLKGKDLRILHSHRYKENLLAALLSWRCGIPFVVRTQHGRPEPFEGAARIKHGALQQLDRLTARRGTDCIIAVTRDLREYISRYVEPSKVTCIHNGIDTEQVQSDLSPGEAKARLGVPPDSLVIGSAGRLEPIKRLDLFLTVASQIANKEPRARFVVVGDGSEGARLRALAQSTGLGNRILLPGHRDDIYDVMCAFDLFLMTSDHEGLPTALLEALYLGIPVVARRSGGIPEVIEDGVHGMLIPSADATSLAEACLQLLRDSRLRETLRGAGIRRVKESFTFERTATKVSALYSQLCGNR